MEPNSYTPRNSASKQENFGLEALTGFDRFRRIYSNKTLEFLGAVRQEDGQPVILKVFKGAHYFQRDFSSSSALPPLSKIHKYPGVAEVVGLERTRDGVVMIIKSSPRFVLKTVTNSNKLNLHQVLQIGIRVTEILGAIHVTKTIHSAVNPFNIAYEGPAGRLQLLPTISTCFGNRESISTGNHHFREEPIDYVSPAQTGRTNLIPDYRSDYYSLGIVLYELLVGTTPFAYSDFLEIVHGHLARLPVPPKEMNSEIPDVVSDVVMKLLCKDREDRYQSSSGIIVDLTQCLSELSATGRISWFQLGRGDVPEQFRLPQRLYGRKSETDQLLHAFNRVKSGQQGIASVAGPPGSGKTSLVMGMSKVLGDAEGQFVAGKFTQRSLGIPYEALIQALGNLVDTLLTRDQNEIGLWREKILKAVGNNASVITSLISKLELIIGPQPALPEVGPLDAQKRFHLALEGLIGAFGTPERPLVMFLDDCQWADRSSLRFLEWLIRGERTRYVLIVCAYRRVDGDSSCQISRTINELAQERVNLTEIRLPPLTFDDVLDILVDTLGTQRNRIEPLARVVHNNTAGNPLFVSEHLESLHNEQLIMFDSGNKIWKWDLERIKSRVVYPGVIDLVKERIKDLPAHSQESLKIAACLGFRIELRLLAAACGSSYLEVLTNLMPAIHRGLVVALGNDSIFASSGDRPQQSEQQIEIQFVHDQIQQAAYELISSVEKPGLHKKIGWRLIEALDVADRSPDVFVIADQLNAATALFVSHSERELLAKRNLMAGIEAKSSAAHESALDYLTVGISVLGDTGWRDGYQLCLRLHLEAAEAAWLCGRFDQTETFTGQAIGKARTLLDRVRAEEIAIQASFARGNLREAVERAQQVLRELGIDLPLNPSKFRLLGSAIRLLMRLLGRNLDELRSLPTMSDPARIASIRIMAGVATAVYWSAPNLIPLVMLELVRLSLKYGNAPASAFAYVCLGFILCGSMGMIEKGYALGKVGVSLALEPGAEAHAARPIYVFNSLVRHWKDHISETSVGMFKAHERALQNGDLEYAALGLTGYCLSSFLSGKKLDQLAIEMIAACGRIRQFGQEPYLQVVEMHLQAAVNLMSSATLEPAQLKGEYYDSEERAARYSESSDLDSLFHLYSLKVVLNFLFGDYARAIKFADACRPHMGAALGGMQVPVFVFYETLTALNLYEKVPLRQRTRLMRIVSRNRKKLKKWAKHAPMNYLHKYLLVEAERLRVIGQHSKAMNYYEEALKQAQDNEFVQEEGLAHELMAEALLYSGDRQKAEKHLHAAKERYSDWGAQAKVADLVRRHAAPLGRSFDKSGMKYSYQPESDTAGHIGSTISRDEEALAKALQTISSERLLENLIQKLMMVVMEVGGAERGVLLLESQGKLLVEAELGLGQDDASVLKSLPLDQIHGISTQVINYVSRTKELITLGEKTSEDLLHLDFVVRGDKPKSILCAPLIHQGRLVGLLYLENSLTPEAFPADRAAILRFLCSQAATLIQNARMYEQLEEHSRHLERVVGDRTKEYQIAMRSLEKEVQEREAAQQSLERALSIAAKLRMEAEAVSAAKSEFLTNMSHELRTPLNSVIGFAELLADQWSGTLNEKQVKYVNYIFSSGHHLLELITDILDLAKVESGKMELKVSRVNFGDLLGHSLVMIREKAIKHQLTLESQIDDKLMGAQICADDVKLKQIVVNLLSNAAKFTPEGGTIRLSARREGNELIVSVSDTGIGIKPQDQQRIFEAFVQADSSYSRQQEGTGLGLALTRRLVELHGGRIWVESDGKNRGSTFSFAIPFVEADVPRAAVSQTPPAEDGGLSFLRMPAPLNDSARPTVLVVEDNPANMALTRNLLEAGGYRAQESWTAEEGIRIARENPPDAILMDISLPGMDGLTATAVLKKNPSTAKIPVIALTAHAMGDDEVRAREAGCDAYLTKPIDPRVFYKALQSFIPQRGGVEVA